LQTYSVQKLYASLKSDIHQEGLTLAASWVIGEYGDALLRGGQYEEEELVERVKESDIVDLFSTILSSSYASQIVIEYIITALMKLTTRLSEPAQIERIRRILASHSDSLDVEVQQRAVEYGNLFGYDQVRRGVLEKMPPPEIREEQRVLGEAPAKRKPAIAGKGKKAPKQSEQDMLLDLMGGSDLPSPSNTINGSQNNADLLADILGGSNSSSPPLSQAASPPPPGRQNVNSILGLFDSSGQAPVAQQQPAPSPAVDLFSGLSSPQPQTLTPPLGGPTAHNAYNKNDLNITLQLQRNTEGLVQVLARFYNTGSLTRISNISLQAAVPKTQRLQLNAISSAELDAGQEATQAMRVIGSKGVSIENPILHSMIYTSRSALTRFCDLATTKAKIEDRLRERWDRAGNGSG
jgi:AP-1 complex subunit gamma-1